MISSPRFGTLLQFSVSNQDASPKIRKALAQAFHTAKPGEPERLGRATLEYRDGGHIKDKGAILKSDCFVGTYQYNLQDYFFVATRDMAAGKTITDERKPAFVQMLSSKINKALTSANLHKNLDTVSDDTSLPTALSAADEFAPIDKNALTIAHKNAPDFPMGNFITTGVFDPCTHSPPHTAVISQHLTARGKNDYVIRLFDDAGSETALKRLADLDFVGAKKIPNITFTAPLVRLTDQSRSVLTSFFGGERVGRIEAFVKELVGNGIFGRSSIKPSSGSGSSLLRSSKLGALSKTLPNRPNRT